MVPPVRLAVIAVLLCLVAAAPALAQQQPAPAPTPFSDHKLRDKPKGGFDAQATPTASATATPEATATAEPTATPHSDRKQLPNTGADPLRLVLAGLTLVGFGLALRFRVALADARLQV